MINKKRFTVGSPVIVRAVAYADYVDGKRCNNEKRVIQRRELSPFRIGIVTGGTYMTEGEWHSGRSWQSYHDYDCSSNYLHPIKTTYVWLVRFGFTNKEVKVLDDDLDESLKDDVQTIPLRYSIPQTYATHYLEMLRKEMSEWPRDAKGRWLKQS